MIPGLPTGLSDPFSWGLACATLHPGLRSILVYNCPPMLLQRAAAELSQVLREVNRYEVTVIHLGPNETEDDLWGTLSLQGGSNSFSFTWQPGQLVSTFKDQCIRLVVIPNLALLSLPAIHACITLMGAEVASLQRYGQDMTWPNSYCWLAGCAASDIYQVSPHLLDRFILRLPRPQGVSANRTTDILAWSAPSPPEDHYRVTLLSPSLRERLQEAPSHQPTTDAEVVSHVLRYFSGRIHSGVRREIALARLSVAHAQLTYAERVTPAHVDIAAAMIGLKPGPPEQIFLESTSSTTTNRAETILEENLTSPHLTLEDILTSPSEDDIAAYSSDIQESLSSMPLLGPYLEDDMSTNQEATSLHSRLLKFRANAMSNGTIIGTERTTSLHDLALSSTLFEAAKFQRVRHKYRFKRAWNQLQVALAHLPRQHISFRYIFPRDQFLISPADLRTYRRVPTPRRLLTLVLDYTCLRDCDWMEAIIPHLEWAYTERAIVCLIQVGAATASNQARLRAQKIMAPSILAPSIRNAFRIGPGRATPLAHGLDLAIQTLQKTLQSDRSIMQQARLVVLSDGRGNVPLKASQTGTIELPVTRQGVEDALQVAERMRHLKNVEIFLLNPQPQQLPDLPIALAEALGVVPDPIRLRDKEEFSHGRPP